MMNYRYLRTFLLVALGLLLVSCSITRVKWRIKWDKGLEESKAAYMDAPLQVEKKRQPNIILLVADDLGPYEVSAYGVEHISTLNIDQIGKEGVVFEEGYATAPTCAGGRAGGGSCVALFEDHAFLTDLIDVRGRDVLDAIGADFVRTEVVGD